MEVVRLIRISGGTTPLQRPNLQPVQLVLNRGPVVFSVGGNEASYQAAGYVLDHSAVALINGQVVPYDATNASHAHTFVGMALNSADPGQSVLVRKAGEVIYSGWSLTPGQTFIAGAAGQWRTDRASGLVFVHKLLRAVTPTQVQLLSQPLIFL